jgi:hypothetical protein
MLALLLTCILAVASKVQLVKAGPTTTVEIIPASYTVPSIGSSFSVNVTVENVIDLYAWVLTLYYPNTVLNGTSAAEGTFLKADGNPTAFIEDNFTDSYNATDGLLHVLCTRIGDVPGLNGSGTLVTATFKSTSTGTAENLHLENVQLSNASATLIPFTAADGEVTVLPEFPPCLILPLIMMPTLLALTACRRRHHKKLNNNKT